MLAIFFCFSGTIFHFPHPSVPRMCCFMENYHGPPYLLTSCWAQESTVWGESAIMPLGPSILKSWVGSGYFTFLIASALCLSLKTAVSFIRFSGPSLQWPLLWSLENLWFLFVAGLGVPHHSLSFSITLFMLNDWMFYWSFPQCATCFLSGDWW